MCNGMVESISDAYWPCTSGNTRPFSLLVVLAVLSTGHGLGCVRPYMVPNSWVNLTESNRGSLPAGTVLQYSCDPGYVADGPNTLTCTPLGHWSAEPPRCVHSGLCRTPFEPANGGYTCHPSPCRRFSDGTVIEFFCDQGFLLKGDYKSATCQEGQWDASTQVSCVSQVCVRPVMVQHGSTNLSESNRGSFPVGTALQYSCDSGFVLEGDRLLTCGPLGRWSPEPPRCVRSDVCLPPYEPENGGYTCQPAPCRSLSHTTVIEYFCDEGFILKGDYKYLTCLNGEWDDPMQISCLMDGVCRTPFEPANGGYTCHPSPCRRFSDGTVIEFFCDQGFLLKGDYKYVTCQEGQWDASTQVSCVSQVCVRPVMVQHGSTNLSESNRGSFPVGTALQYSCDSGFVLEGDRLLTCSPLGRWSPEPPRCVRSDVCLPPYVPENGGYTCHPAPCRSLSHATVIEYFCAEGFILKGDYKYLTCLNGEWDDPMQISCLMDGDRDPKLPLGMPTLSIVASTASSVALVLLLVVLFVLLQPRLKSFHRRDQGVTGQPVSIMVEGVQVTLPSYEEAVNAGGPPTPAPGGPESRVQIVLSEGEQSPEAGPSRPSSHQHSEMAVVHTLPPSFSSSSCSSSTPSPSSSCWALEHHAGAAGAAPSHHNKPPTSRDQHSLSLVDSDMDFSDDMPLLKEA